MNLTLPFGAGELAFSLPEGRLLAVASPQPALTLPNPLAEVQRALREPVGAPPLREAAAGSRRVVIVVDDMTRQTPVGLILPALLNELNRAGVSDEQVTVLIALGTHRAMTPAEIRAHVGAEMLRRVEVLNHAWWEPAALASLGQTPAGTPISVNRLALEADFVIGVGSIVPHHIPGFSGGAKIIQPGITGAETTGATHFLSTRAAQSYLGQVENPVRAEMEAIAAQVGLKAIFNVVLDPRGRLVRAVYGHPVAAHRAGVRESVAVYGVDLPRRAEIVIAGSHPCDIEFWQAHKSLYPAEIAALPGGDIILVTPCPEGISVTHGAMLRFAALPAAQIEEMIVSGEIADVVSGALALAWAKVREHARVSVVSPGLGEQARRLGFSPFPTIESALDDAFRRQGPQAQVTVLPHAPDTLPLTALR